jgi:hypothetical protein
VRTRRLSLGALVLASTFSPAAPAAPAATPAWRYASARLIACHRAIDPLDRYLVVEASMHALAPGQHLQMRFDLFRRPDPGTPFRRVAGPGLGSYRHATSGVGGYRFRKRIQNLRAGRVPSGDDLPLAGGGRDRGRPRGALGGRLPRARHAAERADDTRGGRCHGRRIAPRRAGRAAERTATGRYTGPP